jgi:NADH-quinone oxidoreductase subunit J
MSVAGSALFTLCGALALLSALGTIIVKSPIRAAMSLFVHILALSGLFLTLHAHLLAALQVLVYAGAVVVLFVFVIMLIGPNVGDRGTTRGLVTRTAAAAVMGVLTLAFSAALAVEAPARAVIEACAPGQGAECNQFGGVGGFSSELYKAGVVPFELISILLTVAIVGAIAVARGRTALEVTTARKRRLERESAAAPAEIQAPAASALAAESSAAPVLRGNTVGPVASGGE